ncbi:MAG: hypothetical protein KAT77_02645 [Nanoarchaeota archaeon]|nr:hypothetical protein [Nanoarchaeota archaeon]
MRQKISITVGEDTLTKVRDEMKSKTYRNKSHFFELAALNFIKNRGKSK